MKANNFFSNSSRLRANDCRTVLHVGCGTTAIHPHFKKTEWQEIRLDIDPEINPDIVASTTNMQDIAKESVDAVFSSHNLEHLYSHEVPMALQEMHRVLKTDGFAIIGVPNLQAIAQFILDDAIEETIYQSPAGPVTPIDLIYGYRPYIKTNKYMTHLTGFTSKTLSNALFEAGFPWVKIATDDNFSLWAKAYKASPPQEEVDTPIW